MRPLPRLAHRLRPLLSIALIGAGLSVLAASTASAALTPGELVVADSQAFGGGGLIAVDPSTGAETALSSDQMPVNANSQFMNLPFTLAIDASGQILVGETLGLGGSCQGGCGGIVKVDPATGKESVLSANSMPINANSQYFGQVNGLTIDKAGSVIVSDWGGCVGCGKVIKVDPTTGKETLISSNGMPVNAGSHLFQYPQGLALDRSGNILVADALAFGGHGGGIIQVDPTTGKETELSANSLPVNASSQYFTGPAGLAVDAAGNILVADWGGGHCCGQIVRVDPGSGQESVFSSNAMPVNSATQYFNQPVGITVDQTGRIFVADDHAFGPCSPGCGGVIAVDPATGAETAVSSNQLSMNSSNPLFMYPWSVAVVPAPSGGGSSGGGGGPGDGGGGSGSGDGGGGSGSGHHVGFAISRIVKHIDRRIGRARFAFGANRASGRVTFTCKLDRGPARPCRSPIVYRRLRPGRHTFAVRGVEAGGSVRTTWATSWFVIGR